MPLYDVECSKCGIQEIFKVDYESVETAPCPICGGKSRRVWKNGTGRPDPFTPYWTESLSLKPMYIESKKQEHAIERACGVHRVY